MYLTSSLLSLLPSTSTGGTDILSALYGTGAAAPGGNPIIALRTAIKTQDKAVAKQEKDPATARDIAAFRAAVAKAKTPADLLNNPTALRVLLTANGLGSQADYPALAKKALLSDTTDSKSLAHQLGNASWLSAAKLYDFAKSGLSVVQKPSVQDAITQGYAEVKWRESLDTATPGLSNALDFRDRASSIASVDQILGDSTFRNVVLTTLGIPQQIAFQPLEAQEKAVADRIDITRFKDQTYVEQFARRYLIQEQSSSPSSSSGLVSLLT